MNDVENWDKVIAVWKELLDKGCQVDILLAELGHEKEGNALYEYCAAFTVWLALQRAQAAAKKAETPA